MSTIVMKQTTTLTAEQYVAGLTDFGPGRSQQFPKSDDDQLQDHGLDRAEAWADVTEGGGGAWERLHYDWSDPTHVVLTTTDSNVWGGASGHVYTFTPNADGTTEVKLVTIRDGKNLKGHLLGALLGTVGKHVLVDAFKRSVTAVEASNSAPAVSSLSE